MPEPMDIQDALQIVIDLAKSQVADTKSKNPLDQIAIDIVEDMIVNQFDDQSDCAQGLHSWIDEPGKLSPDTRCIYCGELYGDPK